jgi:hypothetical protein
MSTTAPAYTAVNSRRTLTAEGMAAPSMSSHHRPAARKIDWSDTVKEYVQRAFDADAAISGIERPEIEAKLKQVLTEAAESGRLADIDWKTYPLPQQIIQQQRAHAARMSWNLPNPVATNYASVPAPPPAYYVPPKKRRADEQSTTSDSRAATESTTPPWRKNAQPATSNSFESRITYPSKTQADRAVKRQRQLQGDTAVSSKFQAELDKRRQRFQDSGSPSSPSPWSRTRDSESPTPSGPVIGICEQLEKNYFRLTRAPYPSEVRPQHILEHTLALLKRKWKQEGNYGYICDQFKSLRQDLTVQHIKNSFTVDVYELHARIALEKGDMGEYNQCQTQLRGFYALNLGGHPEDFLAYRILYFIHTKNNAGLNDVLADLTPADKKRPAVKHALDTRSAVASSNYHRLFRLYLDPPNMGAYLMDMFIGRERIGALSVICKAYASSRNMHQNRALTDRSYKTKINIKFLTDELGFESYGQTVEFIAAQGAEDALTQVEETGDVLLDPGVASPVFEAARGAAFKVDIKGQI